MLAAIAPRGAGSPCTEDLRETIGEMVAVVEKEIVVSEITLVV